MYGVYLETLKVLPYLGPEHILKYWTKAYEYEGDLKLAYERSINPEWYKITGCLTYQEILTISDLIPAAANVLEIGTFHGRSAIGMAWLTGANVDTCDLFDPNACLDNGMKLQSQEQVNQTIKQYGLNVTTILVPQGKIFSDVIPPKKYDLVFIDGDHSYDGVSKDIEAAKDYVKEGGVIAGDDYSKDYPGVVRAVNKCFKNPTITGKIWMIK